MNDDISVTFPAEPSSPREARRALDPLEKRVEGPMLDDMRLMVTELVTNSVRHADTGGEARVELNVRVAPDVVRVEVSDEGSGFRPERRAADRRSAPSPAAYAGPERRGGEDDPDLRVGGWGLYLVESLATRWGVRREERVHVWFELDRGARYSPTPT
ncbi:MAG: ATP-binding protein [Thermoleophilaceae bacterium]